MADVIPFGTRPVRRRVQNPDAHARAEWWRERYEDLCHERAAEEDSFWRADLETYPPRFREELEIEVDLHCHHTSAFSHEVGPDWFHRCRQDTDDRFASYVVHYLNRYRAELRGLRVALERYPGSVTRSRADLKEAAHQLLGVLWRRGRRRILRGDLEAHAAELVAERRRDLERAIASESEGLHKDRQKLSGGVYTTGRAKGQPIAGGRLHALQNRVQSTAEDLERHRRELADLDSEPDVMRAAGIWPRRRG